MIPSGILGEDQCAAEMKEFLKRNGIKGKHLILNTGAGMGANSAIYDDEKNFNISDNGIHEAIVIKLGGQDVVFDNVHPNGKKKTEWESMLQTPARITYHLSFQKTFNPKEIIF